MMLDGSAGRAPGAGGGGAGVVGKDAVGAEGGGGGEIVCEAVPVGPESGIHHLQFRVGKGGVGGPGEDTIVNFCDENGRVLRSIVAKGGNAGAPAYIEPPIRSPTNEDIMAGLRISGIIAAEYMRCDRNGLWTIVDGGWDFWESITNPFRAVLLLLIEIQTGTIEQGTLLKFGIVVRSPDGLIVHETKEIIPVDACLVRRSRACVRLEFSGSEPGVWRIQVLAGHQMIGEFPIEIRVPSQVLSGAGKK